MKKIIIGLVGLVAVLFVGVNLFGAVVLEGILEDAIGAPVSVGRLHVGIFSSSVGLYRVTIQNPEGFREKTLAEIHEISVKYDLAALFRGKAHLKTVRLDFGDVTVEKTADQVNLLELGAVKGMTKGAGSGGKEEKPRKPGGDKAAAQKGPGFQMDEVFVNIGKVRYVDSAVQPPLVKEYDLGVHNETFKNVTNTQGLVKDIVFLILRKVGLSSLTGNFDLLMKGVGGGIQSSFEKLLTS